MEFGICSKHAVADIAKEAGFTYLDAAVMDLLCPDKTDAEFEDTCAKFKNFALPTRHVNCLLPGGMFVAGPEADLARAVTHCTKTFERAKKYGIETICFGSGKQRTCPEGFDMDTAKQQVLAFINELIPIATEVQIPLCIEGLKGIETNICNTISQVAEFADWVKSPYLGMVLDGHHWLRTEDSAEDIVTYGSLIRHTHIATAANRFAPGDEECDFSSFAAAVKKSGYNKTLSIEGKVNHETLEGLKHNFNTLHALFN